jgi:catecholate siderophore receptor
LRGFAANSDIYLDGAKDNGQYNRDTFFIEKAEVLKGSSSIMFGRGSTGGVINQTTKKADGKEHLEGSVSYGSNDNKRVTIDAGTALNDVVSVRLNALVQDSDSYRDENYVERQGLAPSIKFKFTDKTDLTLNYLYQNEDGVFDYGVPMLNGRPADVKGSKFYGFKDDLLQEFKTNIATAILAHEFSDEFSVKNTLRYGDYYRKYRNFQVTAVNQAAKTATYSQSLRDSSQENLINQTDFVLKTPLAGMPNTLAFGLEFGQERFDFRSKNSFRGNTGTTTTTLPISILNPVFADSWVGRRANDFSGTLANDRKVVLDTKAAYVQDQLEITKQWKLLAGIRYDDFKADQTDFLAPASNPFDSHNHAWSPRTGAVWQPDDAQSYYVSYGESFNPTAETFGTATVITSKLDPETNSNKEIGAKWEMFGGKLSLTSAIYRLEKDNARTTDSVTTLVSLSGNQRTDGFELGLAGELADGWNVSAAYSYMDAEVVKSKTTATGSVSNIKKSLEGMTPQNVAQNSGSVWTTYTFMQNWEVGGGVFASGSRFTDTVEEVKLPGYMRLDGVVAYHQPKYDVQLNVYNLLDKKYYESGQQRSALPGIPVSGMLTLSLRY